MVVLVRLHATTSNGSSMAVSSTSPVHLRLLDSSLPASMWRQQAVRRLFSSSLASSLSSSSSCGAGAAATAVGRAERPDVEEFRTAYFEASQPVIITGAMREWPALASWTVSSLRQRLEHITVPVEISGARIDGRMADYRDLFAPEARSKDGEVYWEKRECPYTQGAQDSLFQPNKPMSFGDFVDAFVSPPTECKPTQSTTSTSMSTSTSTLPSGVRGYLAQHGLLQHEPQLAADIRVPKYVAHTGRDPRPQVNAWLGPAGTVTPLHRDPYHNLLAQVFGKKHIKLYAPQHTQELYPFATPFLRNTSQVDVEDPRAAEKYPQFAGLPFSECVLEPSEMLYIPQKWYDRHAQVITIYCGIMCEPCSQTPPFPLASGGHKDPR
eukprot:jgi/Chlat1/9154/Chrsp97S08401